LEEGTVDEERRLFYVGVTRARKKLFLLRATERMTYGQPSSNPPSRFIQELPADHIHVVDLVSTVAANPYPRSAISFTAPDVNAGGFRKGDIVRHPQYGIGSIRNIYGEGDDAVIVTKFEAGEKKLINRFSKLEKI